MLVKDVVKRVDIPHEDGWMEFKKLSWRELHAAGEVVMYEMLDRMAKLGGDVLSALRGLDEKQSESQPQYDKGTVLHQGILRWSYDADVTPQNIDLLDEETATWAYHQIVSMNKPKTEAERKNV